MSNETITRPRLAIIKNHFNNTTISYNGWVSNGSQFFNGRDAKATAEILSDFKVDYATWQEVLAAVPTTDYEICDAVIEFAFKYCKEVSKDKDMRQIIIDSKDAYWAYKYCVDASNYDDDMRPNILDSKDVESAYNYNDMRQVIIDAKDPQWAFYYCYELGNDKDMRQVIIDAKNALWAYEYCIYINKNDAEMQEIAKDYKPKI